MWEVSGFKIIAGFKPSAIFINSKIKNEQDFFRAFMHSYDKSTDLIKLRTSDEYSADFQYCEPGDTKIVEEIMAIDIEDFQSFKSFIIKNGLRSVYLDFEDSVEEHIKNIDEQLGFVVRLGQEKQFGLGIVDSELESILDESNDLENFEIVIDKIKQFLVQPETLLFFYLDAREMPEFVLKKIWEWEELREYIKKLQSIISNLLVIKKHLGTLGKCSETLDSKTEAFFNGITDMVNNLKISLVEDKETSEYYFAIIANTLFESSLILTLFSQKEILECSRNGCHNLFLRSVHNKYYCSDKCRERSKRNNLSDFKQEKGRLRRRVYSRNDKNEIKVQDKERILAAICEASNVEDLKIIETKYQLQPKKRGRRKKG